MTNWTKERDRLACAYGERETEGSVVGEEYYRISFRAGWDARDVEIKARIAALERWKLDAEAYIRMTWEDLPLELRERVKDMKLGVE